MFYDQAHITVTAGSGGNGSIHMRREKYIPRGGPDGGDGGRGGSVYFEADTGQNTLLFFRSRRHFEAGVGGNGSEKKMHGRAGEDIVIRVPPGTVVRDAASGEILADVVEPGKRLLIARGGRGGLGNVHFATSTQQTPEFAQKGEPGETRELDLELRVIADVGLVGYPNAGKSSLLAAVSAARPKIAEYPFTTLEPNLGVVGIDEQSFIIADIPGLIEGASTGAGLGLKFLRHVERTRLLLHVVDLSGQEGREPLEDFERINQELRQYSEELAGRPQIVAANKMDLPEARARWDAFRKAMAARQLPVFPISAATREGLEPLLRDVAARLDALKREAAEREAAARPVDFDLAPDHQVYTPLQQSREYEVEREADGMWRVTGKAVERAVQMTDFENPEGVKFLQTRLRGLGVNDALRKAGARPGDLVRVADYEMEWLAPPIPPKRRRTARERKLGLR